MVAYSFKSFFAPQIEDMSKAQTVRADRKRHARPGEALQLFVAMRTKSCRKLLTIDPVCLAVAPIVIQISSIIDELIASIEIDGQILHRDEIETFSRLDGFSPERVLIKLNGAAAKSARQNMGMFWQANYPHVTRFEGVLITWGPSAQAVA